MPYRTHAAACLSYWFFNAFVGLEGPADYLIRSKELITSFAVQSLLALCVDGLLLLRVLLTRHFGNTCTTYSQPQRS